MPSQNLSKPICFSGSLKANESEAPVTFQAHISPFGEIELEFDKIAVTNKNCFIQDHLFSFDDFSLSGKAENGIELSIESLGLNNSEVDFDRNIISLKVSRCPEARFIRKLDNQNQSIRRWLKGFRSDPARPLIQQCQLDRIAMGECHFDDPNEVSGCIKIEINEEQIDFEAWHNQANKLLDYVLGIMHFATGKMFKTPIIENYTGTILEVMVLSQTGENTVSDIPVCSYIDRQSIFNAAVTSYFNPPYTVNLLSTIEWFIMDSSIYEVRLIHAFTALENIIASNLEDSASGKLILPVKQFEKYRRKLRVEIKKCIERWPIDDVERPRHELDKINEGLADLNRRSLREKLNILAKNWAVPLEDINDSQIKAAVNARNLIVHTGSYNLGNSKEKWEHLCYSRNSHPFYIYCYWLSRQLYFPSWRIPLFAVSSKNLIAPKFIGWTAMPLMLLLLCRLPLRRKNMINNGMRPIHPGEILREDYLIPLGLSVNALANALRVPATRLHEIIKERRAITPDTALRLARYFGGDAQSWMNLQTAYDLRVAEQQALPAIEREILPREAA